MWKSRKFRLAFIIVGFMTIGFLSTALIPTLSAGLMAFIGGLSTVYAAYVGSNVWQKKVAPQFETQEKELDLE